MELNNSKFLDGTKPLKISKEKETAAQYQARYYQEHKEERAAYVRQHRADNPAQWKEYSRRYLEKKKKRADAST